MKVVPDKNWEIYGYRADNGSVAVRFSKAVKTVAQKSLPHCARIIIPIQRPNLEGFPQRDEAETLWSMEDELTSELEARGVACLMVGCLTHAKTRELVFQVADWDIFRPPVGKWMAKHPGYDINVSEHEGWDFFSESIWPTPESWLLISDRKVVDNLTKSGSDPLKEHTIEFVFTGAPEQLAQLRDSLLARSYTLIELAPVERRLVMARSMPLELSHIYQESLCHANETKALGLEYDGWGASVVR